MDEQTNKVSLGNSKAFGRGCGMHAFYLIFRLDGVSLRGVLGGRIMDLVVL